VRPERCWPLAEGVFRWTTLHARGGACRWAGTAAPRGWCSLVVGRQGGARGAYAVRCVGSCRPNEMMADRGHTLSLRSRPQRA